MKDEIVYPSPPRHTCVRDGKVICFDDLCHGASRTLCGLEDGIDFGDEEYDDFEGGTDDLYDWRDVYCRPSDDPPSVVNAEIDASHTES